ncbi:MAG: GGDEF domain-containing protein [Clostridia bacterium]|nr:GGDEF domain-containing protein [Clostridia bacterium]
MIQEIFVIDELGDMYDMLKQLFAQEKNFLVKKIEVENLGDALNSIPSMFVINEKGLSVNVIDICDTIRKNEDNTITPVIVAMGEEKEKVLSIMKKNVYCFFDYLDNQYLFHMIKNTSELLYLNRKVSPLTGLPGNVQIQLEIRKALLNKESFALLYFDLDNFKAYNDVYGFLKGDEIIKYTAKIIIKCIQDNKCEDSFVGHIGGDDFVAIIKRENYEMVCRDVIDEFDSKLKEFFTEEDYLQGFLEVANRKGIIEQFPLTSISIGVVEVTTERFENSLQIAEAGAQVKHMAKSISGSSYIIDRRKKKFI